MTNQQAFNQLMELLAIKGSLKIITGEPDPDRDPRTTPVNPYYFVQHDVVKIEGKAHKPGFYKAYSEEGDWCSGSALGLLPRLTEWKRGHSYVD